jgi:glycosyltransferase involved in cell wall biosynthesis
MKFCTIVARNYLPHARVLAWSLARHGDQRLSVLVIDDVEKQVDPSTEPFEVVHPDDLDLSTRQFHLMATIYDVMELSTAMKPWLMDYLLAQTGDPVAYLDPDMELFAPIDDVGGLADEHGIVLTPHLTEPLPRDGLFPDETYILRAGVFNLGFIALSTDSLPFRQWWKKRLDRDCRISQAEGLFVDQRWIDLVPGLFDHAIIRDPGFNVAYWNLSTRKVTRAGSGFMVDDRPLRLFHFSGFSPLDPHLLSRHLANGRARVHLADQPALARICSRYAKSLLDAGYLEAQRSAYRFNYAANGIPIDRRLRNAYRLAVLEREPLSAEVLPDPFDPTEATAFFDFMLDVPPGGDERTVPPYFAELHRGRVDLQGAFPTLDGEGAVRYLEWVERSARLEGFVPPHYLPPYRPPRPLLVRPRHEALPQGVNVIGYLDAEDGVGELARQFGRVLAAARIEHSLVPYAHTPTRRFAALPGSVGVAEFDINLICVNADELALFFARQLEGYHRPHATVAVWAWEVAQFPAWMQRSDHFVDEIWVQSAHTAAAVAPMTDKPVVVMPPPATDRTAPQLTRSELDLPEGFLFLFCFSYLSVFERKNPIAVVEAFKQAFRPGDGPQLVIKSVQGWRFPADRARLRAAACGRSDIHFIDTYESSIRQQGLIGHCDCYVSLHRAEGYGFTMAEAMSYGKPVIATGYSGNLEFMNEDNSFLVPSQLQPIPYGCDPYPPGGPWAEPDVGAAAELMRTTVADPHLAARTGSRAQADLATLHSPASRANFVRSRLERLRSSA